MHSLISFEGGRAGWFYARLVGGLIGSDSVESWDAACLAQASAEVNAQTIDSPTATRLEVFGSNPFNKDRDTSLGLRPSNRNG